MTQAHIELPDTPPIVLMVDDDRDTLDMYSAFFEASGVWVAAATAPAEALDVFDEVRPDLVVTDVGFNGSPASSSSTP